ncbi:winged helix-turn-helix transcriptional regulator [Tumebacillus sp. ITR2]|uniref:Winged helix-turn-helix transcriptional regulator n=1 Tax=Tumebacillus amylolyticus TaxID=2801339 RepID=A0ABS1J6M4_9BACL|nr:metalloregulator ArsR/SmtB family transcription factor [Tumebacillus amylolyticus]MBL0385904.1 winged helix-turn-helix transcriptional regulator [Tumebacillus amylolyticus]
MTSPYTILIDQAPAYELLISLFAYSRKTHHKGMDAGTPWVREVRKKLSPAFAAQLDDGWSGSMFHGFDFLIHQCPGERTAPQFLQWVSSLSVGDLFEKLAPFVDVPADIGAQRDLGVELLGKWDAEYFQTVDPAVFEELARDAERKRALLGTMPEMDVIELATNGVRYEVTPELRNVLLVPQYHLRPISTMTRYGSSMSVWYGIDLPTPSDGSPAPALLRLTKSLGEESRLRILRFIGGGTRSFTEVVQATGLSMSTVHHHLMALRGAGLLTARGEGNVTYYSLRTDVVARLGTELLAYFLADDRR